MAKIQDKAKLYNEVDQDEYAKQGTDRNRNTSMLSLKGIAELEPGMSTNLSL